MKKVIDRRKRSKTRSEEKPVKNKSKNPAKNKNKKSKSFLEISPLQKEILSLHKLQDHAYD